MDFSPEALLAPYAQDADEGNSPFAFLRLAPARQKALLKRIALAVTHAGKVHAMTSYGMKHDFEHQGFYVTNGAFKGAMLVAGYDPVKTSELNWRFKVRPAFKYAETRGYQSTFTASFDMEYFNLLRTVLDE